MYEADISEEEEDIKERKQGDLEEEEEEEEEGRGGRGGGGRREQEQEDEEEEELNMNSPSAEVSEESERNGEENHRVVSIFVGNLSDGTGPPDIKELFESYGITVDHVDMKVCFAFVHCVWVNNLPEIVSNMQGSLFRNRYSQIFRLLALSLSKIARLDK